MLSIKEASEFLGVSTDTLRRWEKANKIKSIRYGNVGCAVSAGDEGENKILALPPIGDELPKFQPYDQQRNEIYPL